MLAKAQKDHLKNILLQLNREADKYIQMLLLAYLFFGIGIADFYDTWWFALGVGPLAMLMYFLSKWMLPGKRLHHYMAGVSFTVFMAQFIYQMHGMFEMHFTLFVASTTLIIYRNWKVFIPFTLLVILHHSVFAYLQYTGYPEVRFVESEFMPLINFLFHILLAAVIILICAFWAYYFRQQTIDTGLKNMALEEKMKNTEINIKLATNIAEGKLDNEVEADEDDPLGNALRDMQLKLREADRREKQEKYINVGLAELGDILRKHDHSLEELAEKVTAYLVKYLEANQGAIFILNDEEGTEAKLEMRGCYAYGKKKHLEKEVLPGQGLVGQVYLEKQVMYLTDVPSGYVNITSGLGEATASCLIVVPLKINDKVEGVMEIASFHPFEDYKLGLLEKISESIASTVANSRINERTRRLLEQSRQQTEELRAQEEEMRQNNEEMQATQEEMKRKEAELVGFIQSIDNTFASIEFDPEGVIIKANQSFLTTMGYQLEEIRGEHHRIFVDSKYQQTADYQNFWKKLAAGESFRKDIQRVTKSGEKIWLDASYTPVSDKYGKVYKIIKLAQNITARKNEEVEIRRLSLVADNTDNSVVITNAIGIVEYVNKGFTRLTGYSFEEALGHKPGKLLQGPETNQDTIKRIRKKLDEKKPFYEEILNYKKSGESYWISLAVNPIFDSNGELEKYIAIQADITNTKKEAIDYACKMEAISRANAIVEFTIDGKVMSANENYLNTLGYTIDEIRGHHHTKFVSSSVAASKEYEEMWEKLYRGESVQGDFHRMTKSGEDVWFRGNFNLVRDINGNPFKIVKIAQDITAVKQLELEAEKQASEIRENELKLRKYTSELEELQGSLSEKLQEAKNEMKGQLEQLEAEKQKNTAILEGCVDGVISFNDRGTVDFFNRAAEEIWGVDREYVIGRNINQLLPISFTQDEKGEIHVVHTDEESNVNTDIHIRTEVNIINRQNEEVTVLLTKSSAQLNGRFSYTFFVQKISADLF
ncbi:MAG: PAS domain S-box protein [Cyclobacteriaceae bacterium]